MSKGVDRNQVFQTTRVRTSLKNDGSWIHKPKDDKKEQDKAGTSDVVETKPVSVRQSSYVLLTAKKFESVDPEPSPPLQKTEVIPSDGVSANQANGEVIPAQKDVQPEGSTVETTGDTKSKAPTEEPIHNCEVQSEKYDADLALENKEQNGEAPLGKSNVEHITESVEVSVDPPEEEYIQSVTSIKDILEAASPVQPAEHQPTDTTAEDKEVHADTAPDPSNIDCNGAEVPADANVENPVAEISAVGGTVESEGTAEVPASLIVELKPKEETLIKTEPANATNVEDAGVEISVQPTGGSCEKCPLEKAAEDIVAVATKVMVESLPETTDVTNAPAEEASLQVTVESVPDMVVDSVSELPAQPATETATVESCEKCPTEQGTTGIVEAVAEIVVDSSPAVPVVNNATPGEEPSLQNPVQSVPDTLSEPSDQPAADAGDSNEKCPTEQGAKEIVEAVAEIVVESLPETPVVNNATTGEEAPLQVEPASEPPTKPEAENTTEEKCPPEQGTTETVEAATEIVVESSPESSAVNNATPGEEASLQNSVEPVPDSVSESPTQPAAETVVKSVESEVQPAVLAQPVLKTQSEEVVASEAQSVNHTVVEQSVEPTPESATDPVVQSNTEDAAKPATASEAEAVQNSLADRIIKLTDALDVEPPTADVVPKPVEDPKPSCSEDPEINQQPQDTNTSEVFQKPAEGPESAQTLYKTRDGKAVCSFCDQIIDGRVKITFSEPLVSCHPECLKCGICTQALGDLLTAMFLRDQVIQCGGCFANVLKI